MKCKEAFQDMNIIGHVAYRIAEYLAGPTIDCVSSDMSSRGRRGGGGCWLSFGEHGHLHVNINNNILLALECT